MVHLALVCAGLLAATPLESHPTAAEANIPQAAKAPIGVDPESQIRLALWCEAHGLSAQRRAHLEAALAGDPEQPIARALLGMVSYHGQWERPEDIAAEVHADAKLASTLAEYRAKREKAPATADAQYKLALWCEQKGLQTEAQAHLTAAACLDPRRPDAPKRLGWKKVKGRWLTAAQVAAEEAEAKAQKKADQHWRPLLLRWRGWLAGKQTRTRAEQALAGLSDPRAVPSIWRVFAVRGGRGQPQAVRMLAQIEGPPAARALATLAAFGFSAEVRRSAREQLSERDPRDVIDLLVAFLRTPIRYEARPPGIDSPGEVFVEGNRFNLRRNYAAQPIFAVAPPNTILHAFDESGVDVGESLERAFFTRDGDTYQIVFLAATMGRRFVEDVNALDRANEAIQRSNASVAAVLSGVTGEGFGTDRDAWGKWWADQQGYSYDPPDLTAKPTRNADIGLDFSVSYIHTSCFGAGTLVNTLGGPQAIETLRIGDQVLTQDTVRGGLSYQPIIAVYHNRPNQTLRISFDDDEAVVATGIHRFWKAGRGWIMARELKPGDTIRTLGGTLRVTAVEPDVVQPVYNLEVAAGQSFFVGRQGLLAHDNSLVWPTPTLFDAPPILADSARPSD